MLDVRVVSFSILPAHKYDILFSLFICYGACAVAAMFKTDRDSTAYYFWAKKYSRATNPTEAVGCTWLFLP